MHTLLLVTLYLLLTNVLSMMRIGNRVTGEGTYSNDDQPVRIKNKVPACRLLGFFFSQTPECNQETALKVLQHCRDYFAHPGVFAVKLR